MKETLKQAIEDLATQVPLSYRPDFLTAMQSPQGQELLKWVAKLSADKALVYRLYGSEKLESDFNIKWWKTFTEGL